MKVAIIDIQVVTTQNRGANESQGRHCKQEIILKTTTHKDNQLLVSSLNHHGGGTLLYLFFFSFFFGGVGERVKVQD